MSSARIETLKAYKNRIQGAYGSQLSTVAALIVLCLILSILTPRFLTTGNIISVLLQSSINSILALGMTFIIITGNIDLAVGSVAAFAGSITGFLMVNYGLNPFLGILLALSLGTLTGLISGLVITSIGIPAFIATLGSMSVWRGLALQFTGGSTSFGLPEIIKYLGQGYVGPIPVPVIITVIVYSIASFILGKTPFGLSTYAIGGNEQAAHLSGINVKSVKVKLFCLHGFLSGLGGLVLAGRLNSTMGVMATGYELDAIAAVVIGGTSMFGGEGIVWGTLVGAVLMGVLRNGLNLLHVSPYWQMVAIGLVIVFAVSVDSLRRSFDE
ncbi:MAG: ABC transporter permease [Spirochaetia bacterium]|nr:ABC transporter permease [Spirochaetia bacterium]